MIERSADPRTEDVIVFELVRTARGAADGEVVGRATFRNGMSRVDAPEAYRVAVDELLGRAFVDRIQSDERPRGYRRSGRGGVDMLVPGMPEHFLARMRGLWLSYPDGSVITARQAGLTESGMAVLETTDTAPPVTDPETRRSSLRAAEVTIQAKPLVRAHAPETGMRPSTALAHPGTGPVGRSDCGWLV